jgi:hypothetical protein
MSKTAGQLGRQAGQFVNRLMASGKPTSGNVSKTAVHLSHQAGQFVNRLMTSHNTTSRNVSKTAGHLGHQAGQFVKYVVPATVKPVHTLWHEVLGFFFLAFGGIGLWKIVRNAAALGPVRVGILSIFVIVMIVYGISSFLKARRISRS